MHYNGDLEQKRALISALKLLHKKGVSDEQLEHAITKARRNGKIRGFQRDAGASVSRATIQRYREKYDAETAKMKHSSAGLMFNFLLQSKEFETPLLIDSMLTDTTHKLSPLISHFLDNFGARKGMYDDEVLDSLVGTFHVYRKAWSSIESKTYIRSILKFERHGNALIYTDEQEYFDPVSNTKVNQSDTGFVVPFNMNVVMVGRGNNNELLKFGTLHGFAPYPNGVEQLEAFYGIYLVIYSTWQQLGTTLYAKRVPADKARSEFYNEGELDADIERRLLSEIKKQAETQL